MSRGASERPAPRYPGADVGVPVGAHRLYFGREYNGSRIETLRRNREARDASRRRRQPSLTAQNGGPTGDRDSQPVTMNTETRGGERGSGGASLARNPPPARAPGTGCTSPRCSDGNGTGRPAA